MSEEILSIKLPSQKLKQANETIKKQSEELTAANSEVERLRGVVVRHERTINVAEKALSQTANSAACNAEIIGKHEVEIYRLTVENKHLAGLASMREEVVEQHQKWIANFDGFLKACNYEPAERNRILDGEVPTEDSPLKYPPYYVESLRAHNEGLRRDCDKANALAVDSIADATEKAKQVRGIASQLEDSRQAYRCLKQEYDRRGKDFAALQSILTETRIELDNRKVENSRLKEEYESMMVSNERVCTHARQLEDDLNRVQAKLDPTIANNTWYREENTRLSRMVSELTVKNVRLLADNVRMENRDAETALRNMPADSALHKFSSGNCWSLYEHPFHEGRKKCLIDLVAFSKILDYLKAHPDKAVDNNPPTFFGAGHVSVSGIEEPKRCLSSAVYGVPIHSMKQCVLPHGHDGDHDYGKEGPKKVSTNQETPIDTACLIACPECGGHDHGIPGILMYWLRCHTCGHEWSEDSLNPTLKEEERSYPDAKQRVCEGLEAMVSEVEKQLKPKSSLPDNFPKIKVGKPLKLTCPSCGSNNVVGAGMDAIKPFITAKCRMCGCEWELIDIPELSKPALPDGLKRRDLNVLAAASTPETKKMNLIYGGSHYRSVMRLINQGYAQASVEGVYPSYTITPEGRAMLKEWET